MNNLYGSYLAAEGSKVTEVLIILELTNINLQRSHIKEGNSDFIGITFHREHILWLISLIWIFKGALGDNITYSSVHNFVLLISNLFLL
jgi:hypothetical protein